MSELLIIIGLLLIDTVVVVGITKALLWFWWERFKDIIKPRD